MSGTTRERLFVTVALKFDTSLERNLPWYTSSVPAWFGQVVLPHRMYVGPEELRPCNIIDKWTMNELSNAEACYSVNDKNKLYIIVNLWVQPCFKYWGSVSRFGLDASSNSVLC